MEERGCVSSWASNEMRIAITKVKGWALLFFACSMIDNSPYYFRMEVNWISKKCKIDLNLCR